MNIKFPQFMKKKARGLYMEEKTSMRDAGVWIAFVGAIAVLLVVAGYAVSRIAGDRAYREKWKDYNDCGWA